MVEKIWITILYACEGLQKRLSMRLLKTLIVVLSLIAPIYVEGIEGESLVIEQYRKALDLNPDDINVRYQLGIALLKEKAYKEALIHLLKVYNAMPYDAGLNYNLGLAYAGAGELEKAFDLYKQVEKIDKEGARERYALDKSFYNIGVAYQNKKEVENALKAYEESARINPEDDHIYCRKGELYFEKKDYDMALENLRVCGARLPEEKTVRQYILAIHQAKGISLLENKKYTEAALEFQEVLVIEPENEHAIYSIGYIYYQLSDHTKALSTLEKLHSSRSSEIRNNVSLLFQNIGGALYNQGDWKGAEKVFKNAIEFKRDDPDLHVYLGYAYMSMNDYTSALQEIKEALRLNPQHAKANRALATVSDKAVNQHAKMGEEYLSRGAYADALREFIALLTIDTHNSRGIKGREEAEKGLEALRQIEEEKRQEEIASGISKGESLISDERYKEAILMFRSVLTLNPENPTALHGIGIAEGLLKEKKERHTKAGDEYIEKNNYYLGLKEYKKAFSCDMEDASLIAKIENTERRLSEIITPLLKKGKDEEEIGRLREALEAYGEALKFDPENREALKSRDRSALALEDAFQRLFSKGRESAKRGDFFQANGYLRQAAELKPDDPSLKDELLKVSHKVKDSIAEKLKAANASFKARKYGEVIKAYEEILYFDKENEEALKGLQDAMRLRAQIVEEKIAQANKAYNDGNYSQAYRFYKEVLAIDKGNETAMKMQRDAEIKLNEVLNPLLMAAREASKKGDAEKAIVAYRRVLNVDPENSEAKEYMRKIDATKKQKAIEKEIERYYLHGIELYTNGEYLEAIKAWKKVLELNPKHEKAILNIEKAKRKLEGVMDVK